MKADLIIDLQFGSTGKGLIAGYLGVTRDYDMVINANMPNAGHTFIDDKGQVMVHKVLPNGLVGKTVKDVMIGPASVFSLNQLVKELIALKEFGYDHFELHIHESAVVLTDEHREAEQCEGLNAIGSTKQGSATAIIQKMMRDPKHNPTAKNVLRGVWRNYLISNAKYMEKVYNAKRILLEGAQGYSLGMNAGFYPYCTSRDCTPARFMSDMGIPLKYLCRVIGTARMHPIRVGSPEGGYSGDCYLDQKELSWEELGVKAEKTTVTQRVRRVFSWSQIQMREALLACQPDEVFLNFCNYAPEEVSHIINKIIAAGSITGNIPDVRFTGWGATVNDIKEDNINKHAEKKHNG